MSSSAPEVLAVASLSSAVASFSSAVASFSSAVASSALAVASFSSGLLRKTPPAASPAVDICAWESDNYNVALAKYTHVQIHIHTRARACREMCVRERALRLSIFWQKCLHLESHERERKREKQRKNERKRE
jgi:hypothetical protein